MTVAEASLLFLVQLGFGSMLTFVVNDRDALGPKYFKVGGWILLALYGLALTLVAGPALAEAASPADRAAGLSVAATAVGMLAFASVSGWDRPRLEAVLLWTTLAIAAVAVVATVVRRWDGGAGLAPAGGVFAAASGAGLAPLEQGLALGGAFGSALVLGFTIWAMILGHWYLVAPGLDIGHLARLVMPLPFLLAGKTVLSGLALWLMWDHVLGPGGRSLADELMRRPERVLDAVNLFARIPVGLLVPLVLAFMTRVTVREEKTQPATGLLYAMCGMVLLGDLMGKMFEGATGVPL